MLVTIWISQINLAIVTTCYLQCLKKTKLFSKFTIKWPTYFNVGSHSALHIPLSISQASRPVFNQHSFNWGVLLCSWPLWCTMNKATRNVVAIRCIIKRLPTKVILKYTHQTMCSVVCMKCRQFTQGLRWLHRICIHCLISSA